LGYIRLIDGPNIA